MIHYNKTVSRLREYLFEHPRCRFVITGTKLHFCDAEVNIHWHFYDNSMPAGSIPYSEHRKSALHGYIQLVDNVVTFRIRSDSDEPKQWKSNPIIDRFIQRGYVDAGEKRLSFEW